ncbi:hypothetical protein KUTeg_012270 [Tegillarca granosa]|uniref:TFIIF beta subunit HTH domain-containing protein n=1 Tax=Tegillarca granosa TaxID=220873 RepID=A0ABQ9F2J9_TEGGR|nr:hypothetical protein KUTeg_012270 [Tegillarca granosa]
MLNLLFIFFTDKVAIEGKVIQRAECRPNANDSYLKLKRLEMERSNKPKREVKQISTVVPTYRPVKDHSFNTYLKEILKEICIYNMKAPHRNMWELKPEYRHYKEQAGT